MDWPTLLGTGLGSGTIGILGTLGARWISARIASRKAEADEHKAELEHDARVSPRLLSRIAALEEREVPLRAEIAELRTSTADCHRMHRQSEERAVALERDREECKRELAGLRGEVQEIARTLRTQRSTPPDPLAAITGRTVLVVDDDADTRRTLAQLCESLGHRALTADSSAAALATLAAEERVDVVLVDWVMPGADGVALIEAIRRSRRRVPVVLITGAPQPPDAGVPVLRKPISREQLTRTIEGVLDDTGRYQAQR